MILDPLNLMFAGDWAKYQITGMSTGTLDVRKLGPKLWEMRSEPGCLFKWTWDLGEYALLVPLGYRSDGASVPKHYRSIVDPEAAFDWAWPHDMIYEAHGGDRPFRVWNDDSTFRMVQLYNALTGDQITIDRCRADSLLFCGWMSCGMKRLEAVAGYDSVRQFGNHAWDVKI